MIFFFKKNHHWLCSSCFVYVVFLAMAAKLLSRIKPCSKVFPFKVAYSSRVASVVTNQRGGAVADYLLIMTVVVGVTAPLVYKYFAEPLQNTFTSQREELVSFIAQDRKSTVPNTWFAPEAVGGGDGAGDIKEVGNLETGELSEVGDLGAGADLTVNDYQEGSGGLETKDLKDVGQLDGPKDFKSGGGAAGGSGGASTLSGGGGYASDSSFGGGATSEEFFGEKPGGKGADTVGSNPSGAEFGSASGGSSEEAGGGAGGANQKTAKGSQGGKGQKSGDKEAVAASKGKKGRMAQVEEEGRRSKGGGFDWWMILKLIVAGLVIFFVVVIIFSSFKRTS